MRILIDYRAALRERTGAGDYAHRLAAALVSALPPGDSLTLFSSSWKDRLRTGVVPGASAVDARVPVSFLNFAWHRLEWPPAEWFAGRVDITQSMHPLLLPSRRGARFVTIHDLYFLDRPDHTSSEIRRDYPALAADHARRADGIVVPSEYTRRLIRERLGVDAGRVIVCAPGAPSWTRRPEPSSPGPMLFIGTVGPRKNVEGLLRAYAALADEEPDAPPLVIAGRVPEEFLRAWKDNPVLRRCSERVEWLGYVSDERRLELYRTASVLVLPSFDEGFGIPALEAMTLGLPVIAADRGSLPEVLGGAGILVDPQDHAAIAAAISRVLNSAEERKRLADAGVARAAAFSWDATARRLLTAYTAACARHRPQ